jgi:LL-diaminopimelate aminotransferase
MKFETAKRYQQIPPYLFARIDKMKQEAIEKGADIINLGIGDPDLPTPKHIINSLCKAAKNPKYHQYPPYEGFKDYRQACSDWFFNRFGERFDANTEVLAMIGSKEGIGHFPIAFIEKGDVVLVPDPGYPVYHIGTTFMGGTTYRMPLLAENGFLPDLKSIPEKVLKKAKIMWLNYPNNPTGAVANLKFFQDVVKFAKKNNIIVCHDMAYSEIYYDGKAPLSFFNAKGAREVGIEFHSLSKTYNMTGWRIGFAVGNPELIKALGNVKNNLDSGQFGAIQEAGITAMTSKQDCVEKLRKIYQERRDILVKGLESLGWNVFSPEGGFYVWIKVPKKYDSMGMTAKILQETGIVTTPGVGFGKYGEGYIRMTVTTDVKRLKEAVKRLSKVSFK